MNVTNIYTVVTGKADNTTTLIKAVAVESEVTANAEILDNSTIGNNTEQTIIILVCNNVEVLDGMTLTIEVTSIGSLLVTPETDR